MRPTVFQKAEIRDENDVIVQQGTYGKGSALSNSTNDGWVDYVMNNLEFLYGLAKDEVVPVSALPASGDMNKTYLLTTTGVCYRWDGTAWVEISSSEAVGRAEAAANLAEQWATKTDGTVADNEYSAKYYANAAQQSADDAQDVADDMADHLAQIDQNTGGVSANSKRIGNIEKLLQGNLYDYDTDDNTAYTKTVPSGAMPYAGLEKVGGKTVVWNQLEPNPTAVYTSNNKHALNTGTQIIAGHKYYMSYTASGTSSGYTSADLYARVGGSKVGIVSAKYSHGYANIVTSNYSVTSDGTVSAVEGNCWIYVFLNGVDSITNIQLVDLTLMFGAGNEPTTVEEFEAMFPASYYPYNAGTLLSAGVTEVVSKDANSATLQTYPIPTAIRNLEGYGWSAGSVYNYIDYERKVFVKNVEKVDLGTLGWVWQSAYGIFASNPGTHDNTKTMINNPSGITCTRYVFKGWYNAITDMSCGYIFYNNIAVKEDSFNGDTSAFTSAMSGIYACYPLATPQEIDISEYLTDDNLINVEAGGTLTFHNSNGDDYQIPVPSEETYMIDLQSAIGG